MIRCDMDNGEGFALDDISDGFFPQDAGAEGSDYSWGDEFISSAESQEPAPSSVPQQQVVGVPHIPSQSVVSGQYVISNPVNQAAGQGQSIQFIQPVQNVASNIIGSNAQLVRGPNGQLILKAINGGNLQVQQTHQNVVQNIAQNLQTQQTVLQQNQTSVLQQGQTQIHQLHSTVLNRSVTPTHPSPAASPLVSRAQTPASSPHVHSRSVTPSQSSSSRIQGQGHQQVINTSQGQQVISNAAGTSNLNVYQLPGNQQSQFIARGIQLQGLNQLSSNNAGGISIQGQTLQGQAIQGLVQTSQGQTFLQGQGQTAVLQGQGQNIVNTQNTVIQNPNVVNLNVAHVLCNPNLQSQGTGSVQQIAPGVQGTLIQLADGKHIIIPSQNIQQAGQPLNLQQILQPQMNVPQNTNTSNTGMLPSAAVVGGNIAVGGLSNVIRLAPTQQGQEKASTTHATHYIGVNQQGQQVLIQRAATPQQNIVVRALAQPNMVQLQSTSVSAANIPAVSQYQQNVLQVQNPATAGVLQIQQPTASGSVMSAASHFPTSNTGQQQPQIVMAGQQQGLRIVTNSQGQQMKLVGQAGVHGAIPMTLNLQNLQNNQLPNVQLLQQQSNTTVKSQDSQKGASVSQNILSTPHPASSPASSTQIKPQVAQQPGMLQLSNLTNIQVCNLPQNRVLQTSQPLLPLSVQNITQSGNMVSTACSTVVTSTVTTSVAMSTGHTHINGQLQVMSSPGSTVATNNQATLQARKSAPRLQTSSVHLPPELQNKLKSVQAEIVKIASTKGALSQELKERSRTLLDMRKKILAQGQALSAQQTSQGVELQQASHQQLASDQITGQGQQVLHTNMTACSQTQQLTGPNQQILLPNMSLGQVMSQPAALSTSHTQGALQVNVSTVGVSLSNIVQVSPSMTFGGTMTTVQQSSQGNVSVLGNLIEKQHGGAAASTNTQVPTVVGSTQQVPGTIPTATVNSTSVAAGTIPNVVLSQAPVPTQIKIGNHLLNLHLTPAQKERVEGYLSKMTPEQQQQQISMFLKLQQQQQYQAQVQAQVKAQQNKLQQQKNTSTVTTSSVGSIPLTVNAVQKAVNSGQAVLVSAPGKPQVMLKRVSVAAIPKSQLILQQLNKDQENALKPDTKTPFRSRKDTYRRLLRYHVYQSKHPPDSVMQKDEQMFDDVAAGIVKRSDFMFEKFRILMMKESMREKHTAEMVMIQRLLNEDLKDTIQQEKKLAAEDPDAFRPLPMEMLVKREDARPDIKSEFSAIKASIKEEKLDDSDIKQVNSPSINTIKTEEGSSSRPSTPKVKLVIRNDGQGFSSSIRESLSSDTEDQNMESVNDDIDVEAMETESPLLNVIKTEEEEVEDNGEEDWRGGTEDKPFSHYSDSKAGHSRQNSTISSAYVDISDDSSQQGKEAFNPVSDESDQAVQGLLTTDSLHSYTNSHNFSSKHKPLHNGLPYTASSDQQTFTSHSNMHQMDVENTDSTENKDSDSVNFHFRGGSKGEGNTDSDNANFPFNPVFSQTSDLCMEPNLTSSLSGSIPSFSQSSAQYEPISSPEGENEDEFFPHKLDLSYSVGEHKFPFSSGAPSVSQSDSRDVSGVMEIADDGDTSTDTSDDSEDDEDDDDDDDKSRGHPQYNSQMQSAIDSILSMNENTSVSVQTPYSDQSNHYIHQDYESSQSGNSTINSPQTEENGELSMDDDLDAAVKSILM